MTQVANTRDIYAFRIRSVLSFSVSPWEIISLPFFFVFWFLTLY
jgi:hypothetical protein